MAALRGPAHLLREDPLAGLGCVVLDGTGTAATLHTVRARRFEGPSSELNSHLAVHADRVSRTGTDFHAVIHAQPVRLTYLSHLPDFEGREQLNRQLMRRQPELLVHLPSGLGLPPFAVPGSTELERASVEGLRR